jgi:hypothetical protein
MVGKPHRVAMALHDLDESDTLHDECECRHSQSYPIEGIGGDGRVEYRRLVGDIDTPQ